MADETQTLVSVTKETLIEAIRGILGEDGKKIIDKVSDAVDSPEGLRAAVHQCEKITKLTFDKNKHENLSAICTALLTDLDKAISSSSGDVDDIQRERKIRMVKAKLITIAARVLGNGPDGIRITAKLRNAPVSVEGLLGTIKECEKLASLTTDSGKVKTMMENFSKIMIELA